MSIPEINLKLTTKVVRSRSRIFEDNRWIDTDAQKRVIKILKIINRIK